MNSSALRRLAACALSAALIAGGAPRAAAQGFGTNQVRIRDFDWKIVSTDHFDIHYYDDSAPLVPQAARMLERSYARLHKELDTGFEKRKPFFLYASPEHMQQSNVADIGPGTGGVTEAFKDRFLVFADGSLQWLDTVITHELVHVFQFHILVSGFWRSGRILKTIVYPLWMMEGMAEHFSWGFDDTAGELVVRDAATSGGLIPLWKLEHFSHLKPHQVRLAYETGATALEFLDEEFGAGTVARMLKLFESRFETSAVLQEVAGLDVFAFDRKWRDYLGEKYARLARLERLQEPTAYGEALTAGSGELPEFNSSPVFSRDGRFVYFLSTRDGYPAGVMAKDLRTGKRRRLLSFDTRVEDLHTGNFTNQSRALSLSPDGKLLAFAGTKNHRRRIYLFDLARERLRSIDLEGFETVAMPAFSPDGASLAFAGMKGASTDIYLLDLASRSVRQLTHDPQDDQTPDFSPDGKSIVYSSEVEVAGDPMLYQRRLYRVRLADGEVAPLAHLPGAARDPVHSEDGLRLLFSLEEGGFYDAYELDLKSGKLLRLTRSYGAAYTPTYAPGGKLAFAGFRRGSIHLYAGDRARFLAEEAAERPGARWLDPRALVAKTEPPARSPARDYEPTFSTDLFLPAFFFSSNGGLFWTSYWQGSDMLGDHQVLSFISYASGAGYLDYQNLYAYNRWRTKLRAGAVGRLRRDAFDQTSGLSADEFSHSEFAGASYPLDRYHRVDGTLAAVTDTRLVLGTNEETSRDARVASTAFVRDTVRGRYLVATRGNRMRLGYLASPAVLGGNFTYQALTLEGHQYLPTGGLSALVLRGLGVRSWGRDTPQFVLGGIGAARGYARSTERDVGSHLALATAEWRVPVWSNLDYYMWYIFPDFYFKAISLALFTDAGLTWDSRGELGDKQVGDIRHSYGIGLRLHTFILQLFPLVLHFDYAQRTTTNGGVFYVYIGPLF